MATPPKAQAPEITIPQDLGACQTLIVELARIIQEQKDRLAEQQVEMAELLQQGFRRRSERYLANPEQMLLDFGDTPAVTDAAVGVADAKEELSHVLGYTRRRRVPRPARNDRLQTLLASPAAASLLPKEKMSAALALARVLREWWLYLVLYYALLASGAAVMRWWRRNKTVIYNVDAELFNQVFAPMSNVSLHWLRDRDLRTAIERQLQRGLEEALVLDNPAANWFLGTAGLLFSLVFLTGTIWFLTLYLSRRFL